MTSGPPRSEGGQRSSTARIDIDLAAGTPVLVVGAGIMGAGIAQVAAQAGHTVRLFDARDGAAAGACAKLEQALEGLVAKGKLDAEQAQAAVARIRPVDKLDEAAGVGLVVEAIIENAEAKRDLFRELEAKVDVRCVLASNTSSISVTALANGLKAPGRFVGMHFFNPVPLMKLVEVVSGLETDPAVAQAIFELGRRWGKTPVHARSTPGFIVNRIARPSTPRPWPCCSSAPPSRRCSTRACAAAAFAWDRAS